MNYFFEDHRFPLRIQQLADLDFDAHLHDYIELAYIEQGSSDLYLDNNKYHINSGDFFILFPNMIHRYERSNKIKGLMILFSSDLLPEFRRTFSAYVPKSPIIGGDTAAAKHIMDIISDNNSTLPPEALKGLVLAVTALLLKNAELLKQDKYNISTLKNLLIYCDEHYTEPITPDSAARELHISRSHISHMFKSKLNTTFGKYIRRKRIDRACTLLKCSTENVTDIAYSCGFDSVRTFNRLFIADTGCTPREYRSSVKNNSGDCR